LGRSGKQVAKLKDYLTVAEAAQVLGVSPSTLRNWDREGKLKAQRHPVNEYRLYRREDLERLLRSIKED
jgi:DNA (cytosine-5)-methyltransferase 1